MTYILACASCACLCPWRPEETIKFPATRVTKFYEPQYSWWELYPVPLKKQPFSFPQPFLQPESGTCKKICMCKHVQKCLESLERCVQFSVSELKSPVCHWLWVIQCQPSDIEVCLSYLSTSMVKQHDQGNLQNEGFIWFLKIKAHGEWHIMAGWPLRWKLRAEGSYRDPQKGCRINALKRGSLLTPKAHAQWYYYSKVTSSQRLQIKCSF